MALVLLIVFCTSLWVYFDAKSIGAKKGLLKGLFNLGPAGWFWATLLLWIVAFPGYLLKRSQIKQAAKDALSASPISQSTPLTTTSLEQVEKLGELRQKGLITEDEFVSQKRRALGL